ncbi:MAG: UDP-N-acetylmuramoyl-tripeptide--D-alanyl-D-alanine ligase [Cyclobacteriaceae bacterium]|nr:UDP-N-acetylmuramoyl-tripeptide--D-alanyl-D-alanine ligase [Cyclobacteriaceae bacterium]MCH8514898.1 UDP-N-acetylmuramoyl-tripeptide--D-alanyl-D-alanine ligase [Cyclobacteriaceae bacterium]
MEVGKLNELYECFLLSTGVSIDTRTIEKGNLFFALSGPNFNGNKFAQLALDAGASYAIVDDESLKNDARFIQVENVLLALQKLAQHHRVLTKMKILAITGSNGKTTCKELFLRVLQTHMKVAATQGNLNNHIGVPLTLLAQRESLDLLIVEMGANHVGEIASYCSIAMPDYGFITNIGLAHVGEFGGPEKILQGKSELFDYIRKNHGVAFISYFDFKLQNMAKRFHNRHKVEVSDSSTGLKLIEANPLVSYQNEDGKHIQTQLVGEFNFYNLCAAAAVGNYFKIPAELRDKAIASYQSDNNRAQLIERGQAKILLDAYNSNPNSLEGAIKSATLLSKKYDQPLAIIMSDMLELGEYAVEAHQKIGELIIEQKAQKVILIGQEVKHTASLLNQYDHYQSVTEMISDFDFAQLKGYVVLVKGSRSFGLEKIMTYFQT